MSKFAFNKIKALTGEKFKVMQLCIDKVNQLDKFEEELEDHYQSQYKTLISYIDRYTQNGKIPGQKLKEITPKNALRKEYEFRTENGIRLYAVQADNGKVIVVAGYKGSQKADIPRFRQMIKTIFP